MVVLVLDSKFIMRLPQLCLICFLEALILSPQLKSAAGTHFSRAKVFRLLANKAFLFIGDQPFCFRHSLPTFFSQH